MPRSRVGGSLAPQMTDEKLGQYADAIGKAKPEAQDALKTLHALVAKWYGLPGSAGQASAHPAGGTVTGLDDDVSADLDPLIPWDHEMESMSPSQGPTESIGRGVLDDIELDVAAGHNSPKVQAWTIAVVNHVVSTHFPKPGEYEDLCAAMAVYDRLMPLLTDAQMTELEQRFAKVPVVVAEITAALNSKQYGPIPYPTLEDTPVRTAAFHMLHHARDLGLGREPRTV